MKKPDNQIMVIFGASGDLSERKLIPSLYDLFYQKMLPDGFAVLGVSRTELSDDSFRDKNVEAIKKYSKKECKEDILRSFLKMLYYIPINTKEPSEYALLKKKLDELDKKVQAHGNYLYYLATPPTLYETITYSLAGQGLNKCDDCGYWRRIIIEKPFGSNLQTAIALNHVLLQNFNENQIFRIDHYLGKETVQNLLVTRFSNGFFEPLWNSRYIDRVEITSTESLGVENRGGYYDQVGALRDMVQNHLTQLVGLVAMEPPALFDADSLRNEMLKVFQSFRLYTDKDVPNNVVRGQYSEGMVNGNKLNAYVKEKGVAADSKTETFVALKLFIDNWRWGGVPFYIRTGKRMPTGVTEIALHLKPAPHHLFRQMNAERPVNVLILRIQPDEGIAINFGMKVPGTGFSVQNVNMVFHYSELSDTYIPSAYERLLLDCMNNDSTLYTRADALEETWKFIDPVIKSWENNPDIPLYTYPAGSWGPEKASDLFLIKSLKWRNPCKNLKDDSFCEL
jgi:glucose-6-phosphate 1-dehydrogenase